MKANLSHVLLKVHPLYISNKCPHLCSQQCPSPNSLFSPVSGIIVFWAEVYSVSQYSLAGWHDIVAWMLISICSFVWVFYLALYCLFTGFRRLHILFNYVADRVGV